MRRGRGVIIGAYRGGPTLPRKKSTPDPAERFRGTRAAHRDEIAQDYAEAVLTVVERSGECRVRDLAAMMGVSHVTVSKTVARLQRAGVVTTAPYRPVSLTPAGLKLARDARERHEVVRRFLTAIGVSAAQAEIDAEGIEHHVSGATIRAMRRVLAGGSPGGESAATHGELRR